MILFDFLRKYKKKYDWKRILSYDNDKYIDVYAESSKSNSNGSTDARNILVYCHVVEKGLSHKNLKPLFGFDRVMQVSDSLVAYVRKGGNDRYRNR